MACLLRDVFAWADGAAIPANVLERFLNTAFALDLLEADLADPCAMILTITPHDLLDSTAWFVVATTARSDSVALREEYTPRIAAIFEEDRAIVESQRPELLPLDLQAERHLRSDRVAIAYRKWLRQPGLRFGVA
jgi:phenylpropionate dioxygenase-like ring-hydroxylating dioxygenase large terminal subunit